MIQLDFRTCLLNGLTSIFCCGEIEQWVFKHVQCPWNRCMLDFTLLNTYYINVCVCHWGNIFEMQVWILGDVCWTKIYMKCLWKVLYFHFLYLLSENFSNSVQSTPASSDWNISCWLVEFFLGILVDPHWKITLLSMVDFYSDMVIQSGNPKQKELWPRNARDRHRIVCVVCNGSSGTKKCFFVSGAVPFFWNLPHSSNESQHLTEEVPVNPVLCGFSLCRGRRNYPINYMDIIMSQLMSHYKDPWQPTNLTNITSLSGYHA